MRIAALYDIHGNLPALEAVLAEVARTGVDEIVVGGDVLPGPMPGETLSRLTNLDLPVRFIRGNGEREVLGVVDGEEPDGLPSPVVEVIHWVADQLSGEQVGLIRAWPGTTRLEPEGWGGVLFCHATPRSDDEVFTRLTPEAPLVPIFEAAGAELVVCGHTHMQFDRTIGGARVVNAGSVGMPFGEPGAYWALLEGEVRLRRTAYDLEAAAARVRATRYPGADEFADRDILRPRPEAETAAAFERAAPR